MCLQKSCVLFQLDGRHSYIFGKVVHQFSLFIKQFSGGKTRHTVALALPD